jgi:hypothetical protein
MPRELHQEIRREHTVHHAESSAQGRRGARRRFVPVMHRCRCPLHDNFLNDNRPCNHKDAFMCRSEFYVLLNCYIAMLDLGLH